MGPLLTLSLAFLVGGGRCASEGEGKQLIMLEIEKLNYPGDDKVVKRQAQVQYSGTPGQYIVQTSGADQQQVPPEYLSLLQQLSPQQQGRPQDIQQVFISRSPQQFLQPQALPPRPPLTPEQQEMRRLQEEAANKHIREQQERALNRALQTGRFETGFQPQVYQQPQPLPTPQPAQQSQQAYQQQVQYESSFPSEPQYYEQPPSPQYYQQRSIRPAQAPLKYSYSQVSFGSSDSAREALEPRLESIQQRLQSQEKPPPQPQYYNTPPQQQPQVRYNVQPQQQPQVAYNVQPQQQPHVYNVQPQQQPQQVYIQPQQQPQSAYNVQPQQQQQQTPTTPQHPQQYLIETTRPAQSQDQVVRIPQPRVTPAPSSQSLYYRPDPAAIPVRSNIANTVYIKPPVPYTTIPHEEREFLSPEYTPRQQSTEEDAPSRSAIYVQHSGISKRITTQPPSTYDDQFLRYNLGIPRIPTPHGQRALTNTEMKALLHAGFQISPLTLNGLQESSDITPSSEAEDDEYRTTVNSKRQSQFLDERKPPGKYPKRIPKPVPLTETERKLLADQGIRNLYRVESSESKDAPVTYVLAIDNAVINKRESDSSSSHKNR